MVFAAVWRASGKTVCRHRQDLCFSKKVCGGLLGDMVCRHWQGFCCCVEGFRSLCGGLLADVWRASG